MTPARKRALMLAAAAAACAAGVALSRIGLGVPCLFHLATGLECPGCGVTRMLESLARADLRGALRANAALTALLPVFAVLAVRIAPRWVRTGSARTTKREDTALFCCIALLAVFGVARNLPFVPF